MLKQLWRKFLCFTDKHKWARVKISFQNYWGETVGMVWWKECAFCETERYHSESWVSVEEYENYQTQH